VASCEPSAGKVPRCENGLRLFSLFEWFFVFQTRRLTTRALPSQYHMSGLSEY